MCERCGVRCAIPPIGTEERAHTVPGSRFLCPCPCARFRCPCPGGVHRLPETERMRRAVRRPRVPGSASRAFPWTTSSSREVKAPISGGSARRRLAPRGLLSLAGGVRCPPSGVGVAWIIDVGLEKAPGNPRLRASAGASVCRCHKQCGGNVRQHRAMTHENKSNFQRKCIHFQ